MVPEGNTVCVLKEIGGVSGERGVVIDVSRAVETISRSAEGGEARSGHVGQGT